MSGPPTISKSRRVLGAVPPPKGVNLGLFAACIESGPARPHSAEAHPRRRWRTIAYSWVAVVVICVAIVATKDYWLRVVGGSLVSQPSLGVSDAILIENVDDNYALFERAQLLESRGLSRSTLVPVMSSAGNGEPSAVALGFVNLMCEVSKMHSCTTFYAPAHEPISLNLARRCAAELKALHVRSVIVVTAGFRSRRIWAIYSRVLKPLGFVIYLQPVFGQRTPDNWYDSWHGVQDVTLEFLKLWYYRIVVLPRA